jgi:hypothetical protein
LGIGGFNNVHAAADPGFADNADQTNITLAFNNIYTVIKAFYSDLRSSAFICGYWSSWLEHSSLLHGTPRHTSRDRTQRVPSAAWNL